MAQPALAKGKIYADAATGDDTNNCTTASTPCKTLAGVKAILINLGNPKNTTIKLSGTFTESLSLNGGSDVAAPDNLNGLRITAADPNNQPTIQAPVDTAALWFTSVSDVEVDHLIITGGNVGIRVWGTTTGLIDTAVIHHNTIQNIVSSTTSVMGIDIESVRGATIHHNTFNGITATLTDGDSYIYAEAIYSYNNFNTVIKYNTLETIGATNDAQTVTSNYNYVYGIYHYGGNQLVIRNNEISGINASSSGAVANASQTNYSYGMYIVYVLDVSIKHNTINQVTAGGTVTGGGGNITGYVYGMYLYRFRLYQNTQNVIAHNNISGLTASGSGKSVSVVARGLSVDSMEHTLIHHNTVSQLTADATSTEAAASVRPLVYGIAGPSNSIDTTLRDNTVSEVETNADYSVSGSSSSNIYGIYTTTNRNVTIKRNDVRASTTMTVNNHDVAAYSDSGSIYGLYLVTSTGLTVQSNTIGNLRSTYASAGAGGDAYFSLYGLYAYNVSGGTFRGNTVHDLTRTTAVNDVTGTTSAYDYGYGMYFPGSADSLVENNTVTDFTFGTTGSDGNYLYELAYGLQLIDSPNSQIRNNTIANGTLTSGSGTTGSQYFYGIQSETSPSTLVEGNVVRLLASNVTGTSSASYLYGYLIKNAGQMVVNSNVFKEVTSSAANVHTVYGIDLETDTSAISVFNNIVLGSAEFDTENAIGIFQQSTSSNGVDIYHNTVSDWVYPLQLKGGSAVHVKDNILSAVGANSYVLAIAYDHIDRGTFISNYNVFYNATTPSQVVYDVDANAVISFNDWTNVGGSWGYDIHTKKTNPKLKPNGHLKSGSQARNHGTTNYQVGVETDAATRLQYDIDGDPRTSPTSSKVDIGADEYTS